MPTARFIVVALFILTNSFSNVASAIEVCITPADPFVHSTLQITDTPSDESSENDCCELLCHCCMQLPCISTPALLVDLGDRYSVALTPLPFYHFQQRKPPTEPPRG